MFYIVRTHLSDKSKTEAIQGGGSATGSYIYGWLGRRRGLLLPTPIIQNGYKSLIRFRIRLLFLKPQEPAIHKPYQKAGNAMHEHKYQWQVFCLVCLIDSDSCHLHPVL